MPIRSVEAIREVAEKMVTIYKRMSDETTEENGPLRQSKHKQVPQFNNLGALSQNFVFGVEAGARKCCQGRMYFQ